MCVFSPFGFEQESLSQNINSDYIHFESRTVQLCKNVSNDAMNIKSIHQTKKTYRNNLKMLRFTPTSFNKNTEELKEGYY